MMLTGLGVQAQTKLVKILGQDLVQMKPETSYAWRPEGDVIFHESNTLKGDTTGASNNREFLLFRDQLSKDKGELFKFFRTDYVSNAEYDEFYDWVIDSIYRESIFQNEDPTGNNEIPRATILKMLNLPKTAINPRTGKEVPVDSIGMFDLREMFSFNWDFDWRKKIKPAQYIPYVHYLYKYPSERFNRTKSIDERKLSFALGNRYDEYVNISIDKILWAIGSEHIFDMRYNLSNFYHDSPEFDELPVQGLIGNQIRGYLEFLRRKYQAQVDKAKLPYRIQVSLPTIAELTETDNEYSDESLKFKSSRKDMTAHWKITNSDYKEFLIAVQDSLIREQIYMNATLEGDEFPIEDVAELINYKNFYYDEVNLSWTEFDAAQPFVNRGLFTLNLEFNWRKKFNLEDVWRHIKYLMLDTEKKDLRPEGLINNFMPGKSKYVYYWWDLGRKALNDSLIWIPDYKEYACANKGDWFGRNLMLSIPESQFWGGGVRRHSDESIFIIREAVNIYPGIRCRDCNSICGYELEDKDISTHWPKVEKQICPDNDRLMEIKEFYNFDSEPDALIQLITYDQALAYYNWKYHRVLPKGESTLYYNLLPSEEEFKRVQNGEMVIYKAEEIPYPTPVFRYVIHVFQK